MWLGGVRGHVLLQTHPLHRCELCCAGSWAEALAFGLSVAVGLSPQMMPMIVTANLSRGAHLMRKQNAIIRRLDAVQNLGAM